MVINFLLHEPTKSNLNSSNQDNVRHVGAASGEDISQTQPSLHRPVVLNGTIREAVLSSVHHEMRIKEARRRNIVIGDVYPGSDGDGDVDDAIIVSDIIFIHFDIRPAITRIRRIGHETPVLAEPLLVTFAH